VSTNDELRADCARCAALCCVATGFERSPDFACTKAPGSACVHLTDAHQCAIHDRRLALGFGGCVSYDCCGAGQALTRIVGAARSETVFRAFRNLAVVHERLAVLRLAAELEVARPVLPAIRAATVRLEGLRTLPVEDLARLDADREHRLVERVLDEVRAQRA
jgi:hypothetical protein